MLDDRLIGDAFDAGGVTDELAERMTALIGYAIGRGAAGVLLTCSIYGPVAHAVAACTPVPVLAADDAAFEDAASLGAARLALVASLPLPLADARARFEEFLEAREDARPEIVEVLADGAAALADAVRGADGVAALTDALERAVRPIALDVDAVLLAQFTISPAASALSDRLGMPVLAGPVSAARRMRQAIEAGRPDEGWGR